MTTAKKMNAGEILSALLLIIGFGLQIAGKSTVTKIGNLGILILFTDNFNFRWLNITGDASAEGTSPEKTTQL